MLFAGDLSDFVCCDERFMLAEVIRKIYQLSVRIYQGLAFGGVHRMELAGKMGAKWSIWEVRSEVVAWVCGSSVIVIRQKKTDYNSSHSQLAVKKWLS